MVIICFLSNLLPKGSYAISVSVTILAGYTLLFLFHRPSDNTYLKM